jgi:signal transduction histidine kinase
MGNASSAPHDRALVQLVHDMRQCVAAGILLSGSLGADGAGPEESERLSRIHDVFLRMDELTTQPRLQARQEWVTDLVQLVDDCVSFARMTHDVPFDVQTGRAVEASCDPVLLRRAVTNVLDNATRAAGETGKVHVRVQSLPGEGLVEIRDEGSGFGRISSVSGQGMSIVDEALRSCRGSLEIISGPGPGTTVRMRIPSVQTAEEVS